MKSVKKTIELAYLNGHLWCDVPDTGHSRNMVNWFRKKHGNIIHSRRIGDQLGVFFHNRIIEHQKKLIETKSKHSD